MRRPYNLQTFAGLNRACVAWYGYSSLPSIHRLLLCAMLPVPASIFPSARPNRQCSLDGSRDSALASAGVSVVRVEAIGDASCFDLTDMCILSVMLY